MSNGDIVNEEKGFVEFRRTLMRKPEVSGEPDRQ